MVLDDRMRKFLEKQISEFMGELEGTVQAAIDLNVEHKLDFIFGYLYGSIFAIAYEYVNGDYKKKRVDLTYDQYSDIYEFINKRKEEIADALYYRGIS